MDSAGIHAATLADAVAKWFAGRTTEPDALARYATQRDEYAIPRFSETLQYAPDLSSLAE